MKLYRFSFLLLALLCFANFYGKAQTWNWVTQSNSGPRYYVNVVTDRNGYIYAGGTDSLGFVLTKYEPDGTKIWSKSEPGTIVLHLSIDTAGNLYTAAENNFFFQTSIITAKLDSAGNRLWTKGISTAPAPNDLPTSTLFAGAADAAGNTYMSGSFKGLHLTQFDTIPLSNLAPDNYFLAKYNSAGKIQWVRFFNDPVFAIACGPQESYFLECGTYFQKYAADGTLVWQQNFSGTFNSSMPHGSSNKLKSDAQGNLYVLGNNLYFFTNLMAKHNSNGTLAWAKNRQTLAYANNDFSLTNAGNILLTGYFIGSATFGNGVPDLTSATAGETLFITQLSGVDGSAHWAKQATTSGSNTGEAILSLSNGNCLVAGNFKGGSTFDQLSLTGNGFFVAKLSGNPLAISENTALPGFQLYPNPANAAVQLSNPGFRHTNVTIYNISGQKVYETKMQDRLTISTENWPAGIYAVKSFAPGKSAAQKLIITH